MTTAKKLYTVMDNRDTITAMPGDIFWRYWKPMRTDAKMLLLTKGGVAVTGNWYGEVGDSFLAWCPMPKRDKVLERKLFELMEL